MSFAERGVYLEMLFEQWEKRFLADNPQAVAEAIASTPEQMAEVLAAWPAVRPKFVSAERGVKRIYNAALERTRRDQVAYRKRRQAAGSLGGKAAAAKRLEDEALEASNATAPLQQTVAPSSDLIGLDQSRREKKRSEKREDGATSPIGAAFAHYHERFLKRYGAKPEYAPGKDAGRWKSLLGRHDLAEVTRRIDRYFDSSDRWIQNSGHTLDVFFSAGTQTKLVAELSNPGFQHNPGVFESVARRIAGNE